MERVKYQQSDKTKGMYLVCGLLFVTIIYRCRHHTRNWWTSTEKNEIKTAKSDTKSQMLNIDLFICLR
jgi:hypothetical protein